MNKADLREMWLRTAGLWQRRRRERELAEEVAFHLAMKQQSLQTRQGLSSSEASAQARRDFGGVQKWQEVSRDLTRLRWLEDFARDLMLAIRMLRKSPVFTAVALITLTLAIGANTAIFSLMNALMLKVLPVPNSQRLVIMRIQPDENYGYAFSYPVFQGLETQANSVMSAFAFTGRNLQMRGSEGVTTIPGELVSGQYFAALGLSPRLGRWITPDDDRPGAPNGMVAVISAAFWHSRMGSDAHVIGRKLSLNQGVFTVVGVMPDGFRGIDVDETPAVFIPFQLEPFIDAPYNNFAGGIHSWWFGVGAVLKPGVSIEKANSLLSTKSPGIFAIDAPGDNFELDGHKVRDLYLKAEPGTNGWSDLRLRFRKPLLILMILVAMVLLIACSNVATLLMARAAARAREISTRFALGASRARILRQLLTESFLLALTGTAAGLAAAPAFARFLAAILAPRHDPGSTPLDVTPDLAVFGFTALIACVATILTGSLPAIRSTRSELQGAIRESSPGIRGAERRQIWPKALLSIEIALSLILVTGASLLGYSLVKLHQIPIGFDPHGLAYFPLEMEKQPQKGAARVFLYHDLVSQIAQIPGVQAASTVSTIPLTMSWSTGDMSVPGGKNHELWRNTVGPDYFTAMRTPLLQGREFRWDDTESTGKKVILNEAAAHVLFPDGHALGHQVSAPNGKGFAQIIGIVADAKYTTLRDTAPPTAYSPMTQDVMDGASWTLLVRIEGPPGPVINSVRKVVHRVVPDVPVPSALNMEETLAESLATERIMSSLALFFGALALLITGIGLYGTLAYATERRTGEIGIRLALGARPANIISMVCSENGLIALLGCGLGIAASILASKTLASYLYGVSPHDPLVFGAAAVMLLIVAAAASLVPAVKASRIDPADAIRYE